jgi:ribosome biogenesis GTPase A
MMVPAIMKMTVALEKWARAKTPNQAPQQVTLNRTPRMMRLCTIQRMRVTMKMIVQRSSQCSNWRICLLKQLRNYLVSLLLSLLPALLTLHIASDDDHPTRLTVGLVGYPNVGKSSTINSLLGEKKVSVSATPGKTKHFQTIHLSPDIVLCDCPGLVFPQFAVQKAELVCDGVLPVDQLRESHGPVALVTKRIGRHVLEATYGLTIRRRGEETGFETDDVSAEDLLIAYASMSSVYNHQSSIHSRYVII